MDHPPTPPTAPGPDRRARRGGDESAPLLLPPASDGFGGSWASALAGRCAPRYAAATTPRGGDRGDWDAAVFLSRSPMVSGRTVALPDLRLRDLADAAALAEGRRSGSAVAGRRKSGKHATGGRPRSSSLSGSLLRKEAALAVDDGLSLPVADGVSLAPLGDDFLRRRTPSGLSLLDLEGVIDDGAEEEGEISDCRVGTPEEEAEFHPKDEEEERLGGPIRISQSCTIWDHSSGPNGDASPSAGKDDAGSQDEEEEDEEPITPPGISVLYALVNASIVLPVLMSFGAIIYRDDFFRPHISVLMKLTVVSGAVHQLTFSSMSSLPFAVGQVQDAGLIFLSAMAGDIVRRLKEEDGDGDGEGYDDDEILATVTVGLSLCTALLGVALVAVGRLGLASYCQLLPTSVVGGYLAYIGFFCGQAGMSLMGQVDVTSVAEWGRFADGGGRAAALIVPGLAGGAGIYWSCRRFRHMAVLPGCIVLVRRVASASFLFPFFVAELTSGGLSR